MSVAIAANLVLLLHLVFVLFVVCGAACVARWPRLAMLHLPAVAWGVFVELSGRACPLTALENGLRLRAGLEGYAESFIAHYLLALLYPDGLTREIQLALAAAVVLVNLVLYGWVLLGSWRRHAGLRPARVA